MLLPQLKDQFCLIEFMDFLHWEKETAKKLRIKQTFLFDQTMDLVASSIMDFSAN